MYEKIIKGKPLSVGEFIKEKRIYSDVPELILGRVGVRFGTKFEKGDLDELRYQLLDFVKKSIRPTFVAGRSINNDYDLYTKKLNYVNNSRSVVESLASQLPQLDLARE